MTHCRRSTQDPHWCETHLSTFSEERTMCFSVIYGPGDVYAKPLTPDPLGPGGVHGYGRCDRCGESFRESDDQAEVAGTEDDPSGLLLDNLIIHADCITDADTIA